MPVGASVGSAVIGAGGQLLGGSQQAGANQQAANYQEQQYQQERQDLMPYMQTGGYANTALQNLTGINGGDPLSSALLSAPTANLNASDLAQTPGYQFDLAQGLESTQNGFAAQGLGSSGAALKGAASYATGLAQNTYQQQYQNQVTNQTNQFNRLLGLTQLGQNSAAAVGSAGVQTGSNVGTSLGNVGAAQGASTVGAANSLASGGTNYLLYNALLGNGSNSNSNQIIV